MSLSTLVVMSTFAIVLIAGLVVDGGQRIEATRRAESVAAEAARAGANAYATGSLAGRPNSADAVRSAGQYLEVARIHGTVALRGDTVVVHATVSRPTIFLSAIGITEMNADAQSAAVLVKREAGSPPSGRPLR